MADNQDKSDDLIAELAKLMASNAQGSESEPKPTVIKLAPLSEATVPSPAPIRIPGMESPAAPATAGPAVRIPGMEKPAGVDTRPVAPTQPTSLPPSPARPAADTAAPESPTTPEVPKAAPAESMSAAARPALTPSLPQAAAAADVRPGTDSGVDPKPQTADRVAPAVGAMPTVEADAGPAPAADVDSTNFDSGHHSGSSGGHEQSSAKPEDATRAVEAPEHDPIADLIAAELDAAQAEPAKPEPPTPATTPAASVFPPSVEAVPARNFGNNTAGQAPVLIARPAATPTPRSEPAPLVSFRPPPQTQAPKLPESDKFAVSPVFGLGGRPTPPPTAAEPVTPSPQPAPIPTPKAPRADSDPMDEIENLIGEAVRMELSGNDKPAPIPQAPAAPVVPPLTTGFAPRRAGLKDNEPQLKSAEAAILAAAAATGAEVGRIEAEAGEDRPYRRVRAKRQTAGMFGGVRQYVGLAVAGTLLLAAGFGLYWVLGMGSGDGQAPVLTADTTPAKQAPAVTIDETAQAARSVVFDEISGVAAVDSAETLVSRDETAGASVADVARVVASENTESGLANRKVRTVTVRPDGTIVNGDEAVAGTEALPVVRPNVPVVPGAATAPSDLLAAAVAADTAPAAADVDAGAEQLAELDPIAAAIASTAAEQAEPLDLAALAPATTTPAATTPATTTPAVFDASIVAPTPMPRPADRNRLGSAVAAAPATAVSTNPPASTPLVAVTQPSTTSSGGAAAYVQLASLPSEAEARSAGARMQSRYGSLFGGESLLVQRAELNDGRVTYRLRLPASSLQDATQICASIKANGGDCFATNG